MSIELPNLNSWPNNPIADVSQLQSTQSFRWGRCICVFFKDTLFFNCVAGGFLYGASYWGNRVITEISLHNSKNISQNQAYTNLEIFEHALGGIILGLIGAIILNYNCNTAIAAGRQDNIEEHFQFV